MLERSLYEHRLGLDTGGSCAWGKGWTEDTRLRRYSVTGGGAPAGRRGVPQILSRGRGTLAAQEGRRADKEPRKAARGYGEGPHGPGGEAWRVYSGATENLQKAEGDGADDMGRTFREQCRQWGRQRPRRLPEPWSDTGGNHGTGWGGWAEGPTHTPPSCVRDNQAQAHGPVCLLAALCQSLGVQNEATHAEFQVSGRQLGHSKK